LTGDEKPVTYKKKSEEEILVHQVEKKDVCGSYLANMTSDRIFIIVSVERKGYILYQGRELGITRRDNPTAGLFVSLI
jgi:hypothetical protein